MDKDPHWTGYSKITKLTLKSQCYPVTEGSLVVGTGCHIRGLSQKFVDNCHLTFFN